MVAEAHAGLVPGIEVVLHVDGTAGTLVAADGPVLVEGLGSIDGRLLVPGGDVEVVRVTIRVESTLVLSVGSRVVRAVVFNDLGDMSV
jgi:hypothetical protein